LLGYLSCALAGSWAAPAHKAVAASVVINFFILSPVNRSEKAAADVF
jgi:hypothetical protein